MFHDSEISVFQIEPNRFLFNLNFPENDSMSLILVYKHNIFKIITMRLIVFEKHKHIFLPPIVSVI